MSLISEETFMPHSFAHIEAAGVFPKGAVPEAAYSKFVKDYETLDTIITSRITYGSDGLSITGIRVLPTHLRKAAHPILIFNRGGNREYGKLTVLNVLRHMAPFAQKGYLVFASNYRGNDGGEGEDEFGGRDVDDIFALLDIAKTHPGFDGKNIYIIGHSRGAMMTYQSIRRAPEAFNAAIGLAGISDVRQSARERPSMQTAVFERLFPKGDLEQEYAKRSALAWPEEIHTPLLLLHGDADDAAHVNHSIALDIALKERGKTCELHIYPGVNHSLYRVWDDVITRCLSWMEAYRK